MQGIRIDALEDDTIVLSTGSFFRRVDGSLWGVNLELRPSQKKKSLSISQLPILVRKRVLNPTTLTRAAGYELGISIGDTNDWVICHNGDCPILKSMNLSSQVSSQLCFSFKSNDGVNVYLPQLELARALFFHDAYLARTALDSEALSIEFDVVPDTLMDLATVNVLQSSNYTKTSFSNYAARRVLSWILIDPDARASYESIRRYQKQNGIDKKGYRHWNFQFDPPPLPNVEFVIRGNFDQETNSIFIYEITSITNLIHKVPGKVEFYSPKFKEYVKGNGSGGNRPPYERPEEHNVRDDEDANSNTDHVQLQAPVVRFEFVNPFETTKISKKKQKGVSGRKDEEEPNDASKDVSTEESDETGTLPQADWDIVEDDLDDSHLYANKFNCFQLMLELLESNHDCEITSKQIRKLPKIGHCISHVLKTDYSPRCMAVVTVNCNGMVFYFIEVDTSDAAKSLSTKLLIINQPENWSENIKELERLFLKGSLRWPTKFLDKIYGAKRHKSIPHPKTECANKGLLDLASISRWAERVHIWMLSSL